MGNNQAGQAVLVSEFSKFYRCRVDEALDSNGYADPSAPPVDPYIDPQIDGQELEILKREAEDFAKGRSHEEVVEWCRQGGVVDPAWAECLRRASGQSFHVAEYDASAKEASAKEALEN